MIPESADHLIDLLEKSSGWPQAGIGLLDRRENYAGQRATPAAGASVY